MRSIEEVEFRLDAKVFFQHDQGIDCGSITAIRITQFLIEYTVLTGGLSGSSYRTLQQEDLHHSKERAQRSMLLRKRQSLAEKAKGYQAAIDQIDAELTQIV